jgi:hypothetical protein
MPMVFLPRSIKRLLNAMTIGLVVVDIKGNWMETYVVHSSGIVGMEYWVQFVVDYHYSTFTMLHFYSFSTYKTQFNLIFKNWAPSTLLGATYAPLDHYFIFKIFKKSF